MADNLENLTCPACGEELVKYFDSEKNFHIDICINGCGGLYFDNREFEKYDEPNENIQMILDVIKDKTFVTTDHSKDRICPACQYTMLKQKSGICDIEIDVCATCGAKFLDNNELQKIRISSTDENEELSEILDSMYEEIVVDMIGREHYEDFKNNPKRQFLGEIITKMLTKTSLMNKVIDK